MGCGGKSVSKIFVVGFGDFFGLGVLFVWRFMVWVCAGVFFYFPGSQYPLLCH